MAVKLITSDKPRRNLRWDARRKAYVGWQVDVNVSNGPKRGRRRVRLTFTSEADARAAEARLRVKSLNIKAGIEAPDSLERKITVREVLERRLREIPEGSRRAMCSRIFGLLLDCLPAGFYVEDLRSADFQLYVGRRSEQATKRGTPVTPQTVARELTEISAAIRKAPEYFRELADWQCPPIRRPRAFDRRRDRVISDEERKAIIDHYNRPRSATESEQAYLDRLTIGHTFEFALLTSSRRKEVIKLKWSDYNRRRDEIRITRWKTLRTKADSVTVFSPLPARVREILELRRRMFPQSDYIFSPDGRDRPGYLKSLKRTCAKLGIPYGRYVEGGMTFHDTRHTFVSKLIENNVDIETARELAGLSSDMILRYAHSNTDRKRRAVETLDGDGGERFERLRELFGRVRSGECTFEEFLELLGL